MTCFSTNRPTVFIAIGMQVQNLLTPEDRNTLQDAIANMLDALDASLATAQDDLMEHIQRMVNAYEDLKHRVYQTLRIQHGDARRLRAQQDDVRAFAADANRV